jgi:hypothetical protein
MSSLNIFIGKIVSIGYNILAVKLDEYNKIIYIHKFPPVVGEESVPDLTTETDPSIFESDKLLKIETLRRFWSDTYFY